MVQNYGYHYILIGRICKVILIEIYLAQQNIVIILEKTYLYVIIIFSYNKWTKTDIYFYKC